MEDMDEKEEVLLDEINGARNKKPVMSALNKGKLSSWELDELMNGFKE